MAGRQTVLMTAAHPGRPRSDQAGPALLAAARRLVIERGYQAVSIGDIAQAAGTGRQTLYRRWPGKAELVLAAFGDDAAVRVDAVADDPADPVQSFLSRTFRALDETGPALRGLMAQAQQDPHFQVLFAERFIAPRRAALRAVLLAARSAGTLAPELDVEVAVSALYGGLWYRLLLGEPLDEAYAAALSQLVSVR